MPKLGRSCWLYIPFPAKFWRISFVLQSTKISQHFVLPTPWNSSLPWKITPLNDNDNWQISNRIVHIDIRYSASSRDISIDPFHLFLFLCKPIVNQKRNEFYVVEECITSFFNLQILSAYFVVLPLRDEGAISLGLGNLPGLFVGSLLLTLVAAPVSTLVFSMPNLSKGKVWCIWQFDFRCELILIRCWLMFNWFCGERGFSFWSIRLYFVIYACIQYVLHELKLHSIGIIVASFGFIVAC